MSKIHLNIGSNLGDRRALIGRAVALLSRGVPGPARLYLSSYIESDPWGYTSPNPFLNLGVLILTPSRVDPFELLDITQAVERAIGSGAPHRNPDGTYCDRPIDIDIIQIDNITLNTPRLTLPHPRAALRPFVLQPLQELESLYTNIAH